MISILQSHRKPSASSRHIGYLLESTSTPTVSFCKSPEILQSRTHLIHTQSTSMMAVPERMQTVCSHPSTTLTRALVAMLQPFSPVVTKHLPTSNRLQIRSARTTSTAESPRARPWLSEDILRMSTSTEIPGISPLSLLLSNFTMPFMCGRKRDPSLSPMSRSPSSRIWLAVLLLAPTRVTRRHTKVLSTLS